MESSIRKTLRAADRRLVRAPRRRPFTSDDWAVDVPSSAGVYGIWDTKRGCLVYVGETSDLRLRFRDLQRAINHTFTNKVRDYLGLRRSTSDAEVRRRMSQHFTLAFVPIAFGRSEVEEFLVLRYRKTLVNKPANRLLRGPQYDWVRPA